jgi:nucleotide-binding universal stress UspA family protein
MNIKFPIYRLKIDFSLIRYMYSTAKDSGVKEVKMLRRERNAAAEILLIADEEKVDTIVIGSKGLNTVKELLLGSVSHKVIHLARCPVILVR